MATARKCRCFDRQLPKELNLSTLAHARFSRTTPLSLKSLCGGGVPSSHPSLACLFSFLLSLNTEEDESPVVIPSSAVTMHPRGPQRQHHRWRYKCPKREWT